MEEFQNITTIEWKKNWNWTENQIEGTPILKIAIIGRLYLKGHSKKLIKEVDDKIFSDQGPLELPQFGAFQDKVIRSKLKVNT